VTLSSDGRGLARGRVPAVGGEFLQPWPMRRAQAYWFEQEQGKPGGHCPLIVQPFKSAVAAPAEEWLMSLALKVNGNLRPRARVLARKWLWRLAVASPPQRFAISRRTCPC
jgi:hypothetical protein